MNRTATVLIAGAAATVLAATAQAGEIGHYSPGGTGIRDYAMGHPGFVVVVYDVGYSTNRINDRNGDQIKSVDLGGMQIDVDAELDVFSISPTLIWVSNWKLL